MRDQLIAFDALRDPLNDPRAHAADGGDEGEVTMEPDDRCEWTTDGYRCTKSNADALHVHTPDWSTREPDPPLSVDPLSPEEIEQARRSAPTWRPEYVRDTTLPRLIATIDSLRSQLSETEQRANYWQMNCEETSEVEGELRAAAEQQRDLFRAEWEQISETARVLREQLDEEHLLKAELGAERDRYAEVVEAGKRIMATALATNHVRGETIIDKAAFHALRDALAALAGPEVGAPC
jgi:hypothetical protein